MDLGATTPGDPYAQQLPWALPGDECRAPRTRMKSGMSGGDVWERGRVLSIRDIYSLTNLRVERCVPELTVTK